MTSLFRRMLVRSVLAVGIFGLWPAMAQADRVATEAQPGEEGYIPVEELSFETIIEATGGYASTLKIRTALHNTSAIPRDAVMTVALPAATELQGVAAARGGVWTQGKITSVTGPGRRNPGTVYARLVPGATGDLPAAEVVLFRLDSGATVQVELQLRIYPRLRGGRWEIDLPTRGRQLLALSHDRRVLVVGLRKGESFFVDDTPSGKRPVIITGSDDTVTAAWPAHLGAKGALDAQYEVMPKPGASDGGEFRVSMRLGQTRAAKPDHVIAVVDRSKSTKPKLEADTGRMLGVLLDALPNATTFDAIGFGRSPEPLMPTVRAKAHEIGARKALRDGLRATKKTQGTDLGAALAMAGARAKKRGARKPLIVVVTDGMLPPSIPTQDVEQRYIDAVARIPRARRPQILFIVDDPLMARSGLPSSHPVARVAAALGARISLESLGRIPAGGATDLLSAPAVLGDLRVALPKRMKLDAEIPPGLVAGNFLMLRGKYEGRPPRSLTVSGRFGARKVSQTLKASEHPKQPAAVVAVTEGDPDQAVAEGFALPSWYTGSQRRLALAQVARAGHSYYEARGYLDRKIFRNYLGTRVWPRVRVCYNHALMRDHTQSGRVVLEMEVAKGEVMFAQTLSTALSNPDPKFEACLTEAAWALDIPAGKLDDRIYRVRYPLQLSPPKAGEHSPKVERLGEEVLRFLLEQAPPASSSP